MLKDPEIKLFGRKIYLPENGAAIAGAERFGEWSNGSSDGSGDCDRCSGDNRGEEVVGQENLVRKDEEQAEGEGEVCETIGEDEDEDQEESENTNTASLSDESPKNPPADDDAVSGDQPKIENGGGGTNSQQKTLKKPDKILPCPRCKSMETKFCYYNNYNVNQPRHFCKSCQRYWTAGGTMRNVPVGAGRRKNKNSASHCHHITISEALHAARVADAPNSGFHNLKFKPNATVLSFGSDSPLCESMASALHLAEKKPPQGSLVSPKNGAKADDSASDGGRNGFQLQHMNGYPSPVPCIPGVPWPFPWNSVVPVPAIFPPGYPLPYYTVPTGWNLPWLSLPSSTPTSPLGKHSRNGEPLNPNTPKNSESSIVIPKTLRIDDPEEAAKSSIWSTLGIKYSSISREGLFKALQPKIDEKKAMAANSPLLQANPAAFSRSLKFQETA